MLRKSILLAIALSFAAIASATTPAAASFKKQPQVSKAYNPHMRTTVGRAIEPSLAGRMTPPPPSR
ncbi:hypothetical protein [Bradyrhizobium acaciae]|uniref:hypothetical protein n=1 Tax=Bradyrhizobium acaciae TaxID=2683706 RepID=UPI001E332B2F|nr:hypothetical protein [Bradyrhizobium acaciae]MCC8982148.1 hypothetical protein [Bradyrhizobium acaciae]